MQGESNEGGVRYFLQPGNRMMYGLSVHGQNAGDSLDSHKDSEESKIPKSVLKVTKIDVTDEGTIWNKLPTANSGCKVDFCFRNYVPPNITILNPVTELCENYYFGGMIQRNSIDSISDYIYKFYNGGTDTQPLYVLESLEEKLNKHRLNYGICSFKLNGKTKIMLLGGNKGKSRVTSIEDARDSLYDSCLLFNVETENFEPEFQLKLNSPKDNITAVCVGDNFVYSFFGRTATQAGITDQTDEECSYENFVRAPMFEYSKTIERWKITDDPENNYFVQINLKFEENVQQLLKPWIVPLQDESVTRFIIGGGVKGNQSPVKQIGVLEIDEANIHTFGSKDNQDEQETTEVSLSVVLDLTNYFKVPLSFPSGNTLVSGSEFYTIGMNGSGRPWVVKFDKSGKISQTPILN